MRKVFLFDGEVNNPDAKPRRLDADPFWFDRIAFCFDVEEKRFALKASAV